MIGMAFGCDVCICGLGEVWLGHETCVTLGMFFSKNWGSTTPQVIGFAKKIYVGGANM